MIKSIFFLSFALLFSVPSFSLELTCWDLYAKKGAKLNLVAEILQNDFLDSIQLFQPENFPELKSFVVASSSNGTEITSTRSPYLGNQEFILAYGMRMILPPDLSPQALKTSRLKGGKLPANLAKRQNGVLEIRGWNFKIPQGGAYYLRMHCESQ